MNRPAQIEDALSEIQEIAGANVNAQELIRQLRKTLQPDEE